VSKKKVEKKQSEPEVKPGSVEFYFDKFAATHQDPANIVIHILLLLKAFAHFKLFYAVYYAGLLLHHHPAGAMAKGRRAATGSIVWADICNIMCRVIWWI